MNPNMKTEDRVLAALRARFWLHLWHRHILHLSDILPDLYSVARSFISPASFQILNHLCDTLILLVLAFSRYYSTIPFCIWLFGTEFVEHFFGIARQLLPNFSYAEFLKMVQHIMVQQCILESGLLKVKRECESATGYIFNSGNDTRKAAPGLIIPARLSDHELNGLVEVAYDEASRFCREILFLPVPRLDPTKPLQLRPLGAPAPRKNKKSQKKPEVDSSDDGLSGEEIQEDEGESGSDHEGPGPEENSATATPRPSSDVPLTLDNVTAKAASEAARYTALCNDLDDIMESADIRAADIATPKPHPLPVSSDSPPLPTTEPDSRTTSRLLDLAGKSISLKRVLDSRIECQSGTGIKSERSVKVNSTMALRKVLDSEAGSTVDNSEKKISPKEAAHRLRIAQELNPELKRHEQKKTRQIRWETAVKKMEETLTFVQSSTSSVTNVPLLQLPNLGSKNVTALHPLKRDMFVIMRSSTDRFYIGQVLNLYKCGANSCYGSVELASTAQGLSWLSLRVYLPLQLVRTSHFSVYISNIPFPDSWVR